MFALFVITLVALLTGVAVATGRATLLAVATATVLLGYVFGHTFWNLHLGPLPLTLDRLLLGLLVSLASYRYYRGELTLPKPNVVDWALAGTLLWLTLSAAINNLGADAHLPASPAFRLIFSFWIPALLYLLVRCSKVTTRSSTLFLAALTLLGSYLALTACAEVTQQWWAVFPKYLADPELGTHFGRARGPALNSVSLGSYLGIACWATWQLLPRVSRGWQLLLLASMLLMVAALFFTYTRSVWIGLALSGFVMLVAQTPRQFRLPVAAGSLIAGLLLSVVGWTFVMNLQREDSGNVSHHSVRQRTAFAYVSWEMLQDEPLWGVGFGRFYDKKLPYLADRSQSFELESIRKLHHHNTFLGLLVETGMLGLAGYLVVLGGWTRIGWQMAFAAGQSLATRQMGRLLLAAIAVYLPSALFHDLTHILQDQWLLFLVAGVCVATAEQTATSPLRQPSFPNKRLASTKPTFPVASVPHA